jgi:pimeloyl-ACP methyl ester carboxylesterase
MTARVPPTQSAPLEPSASSRPSWPPDDPDELRALAELGFKELSAAIGGIGEIHGAVAERVFRAVGPGATIARAAHDAISQSVYAAVSRGPRVVGKAADAALGKRDRSGERRLSTTPWGGLGLAAINGLVGDALERERSVLQELMAVRVDGLAVPCEAKALTEGFPAATARIVVFVHGLMGTEFPWWWGGGPSRECYGSRLERDLGATAVYIRYNTGRHISENGHSLGELIAELVAAWPVEVDQLALIGHSMGGLVCRSACYQASEQGAEWARHVGHVVSLGTPHMGAPLAQGVHYASAALHAVPETRPFARFLRRRSGGIRDLRHGSLVDEDWRDRDPDALRAAACKEVPLLEGATHCFVAATIMDNPKHPVARLLGDCLVLEPSASGRSRTRRIPFEAEYGMCIGRTHHIALLNHPLVYEQLLQWLATPPARLAAVARDADRHH